METIASNKFTSLTESFNTKLEVLVASAAANARRKPELSQQNTTTSGFCFSLRLNKASSSRRRATRTLTPNKQSQSLSGGTLQEGESRGTWNWFKQKTDHVLFIARSSKGARGQLRPSG